MKNTREQRELCVVFFVYACFTNFHTGKSNKISISTNTNERKTFLFLEFFLVLISRMFTLGFSCAWANFISVNQALVTSETSVFSLTTDTYKKVYWEKASNNTNLGFVSIKLSRWDTRLTELPWTSWFWYKPHSGFESDKKILYINTWIFFLFTIKTLTWDNKQTLKLF